MENFTMSDSDNATDKRALLEHTAKIVGAYAGNAALSPMQLVELIGTVSRMLGGLAAAPSTPKPEELVPAVPIKKSVSPDFIICLEDGKKLKMLKRHLMSSYDMTPAAYREKWGLPRDYPMVAPNYAATRSQLAKNSGLGRTHTPAAPASAAKPAAKRGRPRKVVTA